jgi:hypothetical protein
MPTKRKSSSDSKSEKLWIQQTLKRLRALQQTRESQPASAGSKKPRPATRRPSRDK